MKKSRFKPPYKPNGRTTFGTSISGKSGVYLIKKNGKIVYIGYSLTDLYKTLYRHFQSWKDKTQSRVVYPKNPYKHKITVRVVLTNSKLKTLYLEQDLIFKYKPEDNANFFNLFRKDTDQKIEELGGKTFNERHNKGQKKTPITVEYFGTVENDAPF